MMKITGTITRAAVDLNDEVMYHSDMCQSMCENTGKKRLLR